MKQTLVVTCAAVIAALSASIAVAQRYDTVRKDADYEAPVLLEGAIRETKWENPAVKIWIDTSKITLAGGKAAESKTWVVILPPPNPLIRLAGGVDEVKSLLKPGDTISVRGYQHDNKCSNVEIKGSGPGRVCFAYPRDIRIANGCSLAFDHDAAQGSTPATYACPE